MCNLHDNSLEPAWNRHGTSMEPASVRVFQAPTRSQSDAQQDEPAPGCVNTVGSLHSRPVSWAQVGLAIWMFRIPPWRGSVLHVAELNLSCPAAKSEHRRIVDFECRTGANFSSSGVDMSSLTMGALLPGFTSWSTPNDEGRPALLSCAVRPASSRAKFHSKGCWVSSCDT